MGLWGRSNKSVLQRHSGFFVFLKPISYNHKGKKDSDALLARKKITDQTESLPYAKRSYNDNAFYVSQEKSNIIGPCNTLTNLFILYSG